MLAGFSVRGWDRKLLVLGVNASSFLKWYWKEKRVIQVNLQEWLFFENIYVIIYILNT